TTSPTQTRPTLFPYTTLFRSNIIHLIERVADHHQTEATGSDDLITSASAMQRFYWRLHAIIAKSHPHAIVSDLARQGDKLIVAQLVSVSHDIRARFIHPQHHERAPAPPH